MLILFDLRSCKLGHSTSYIYELTLTFEGRCAAKTAPDCTVGNGDVSGQNASLTNMIHQQREFAASSHISKTTDVQQRLKELRHPGSMMHRPDIQNSLEYQNLMDRFVNGHDLNTNMRPTMSRSGHYGVLIAVGGQSILLQSLLSR